MTVWGPRWHNVKKNNGMIQIGGFSSGLLRVLTEVQPMNKKKRGLLSWVLEFAGRKRLYFGGSVILAMLGVAASFVPYLIIANIIPDLPKPN